MKSSVTPLFLKRSGRCICDNANSALLKVELLGPLEVSLWALLPDEERLEAGAPYGETGFGIKLVKSQGIFCPPRGPVTVEDYLSLSKGVQWASGKLRSLQFRRE